MPPSLRRLRRHNRTARRPHLLTVEGLEDRRLMAAFTVTSLAGDNTTIGSLGFEINLSNTTGPGPNTINFNLLGGGVHTIPLTSSLPTITVPVTIDGTSTGLGGSAYAGLPLVQIDGSSAPGASNGLTINAPNTQIIGLSIVKFTTGAGVSIVSPNAAPGSGDTITSCFLGGSLTGGNGGNRDGVDIIGSSNNTINTRNYTQGANTFIAHNVISLNTNVGVSIAPFIPGGGPAVPSTNNVIRGSRIGIDNLGTTAAPNGNYGVLLDGVSGNTIGGLSAPIPNVGDPIQNVISGNGKDGIYFNDTNGATQNNVVQDNLIGTNAAGAAALANGQSGNAADGAGIYMISVGAPVSGNTIGGTAATAKNVISGNINEGVIFNRAPGNVLSGNNIGTNFLGNAAVANGGHGVFVFEAQNNTIGGTVLGAGNVISGNGLDGVNIFSIPGNDSSGTVIAGNLIGTTSDGSGMISNKGSGITNGSPGVTIGGPVSAARNVISGNNVSGITLNTANGILITGNFIGTDATGEVALPNTTGLNFMGAGRVTIGGTTPATRNVISGNRGDGIHYNTSAGNNLIEGNFIGIDANDTVPLGNNGSGINLVNSTGDTIGGTAAGAGNVIGGNTSHGISTGTSSVPTNLVIQGNFIGTDSTGNSNLGNLGDGIHLFSSRNTIGGVAAGAANTIAFNGGAGVQLILNSNLETILSNSIHDNGGLGISFRTGQGPTPNHPNQIGSIPGPNDFQNYPVLGRVITDGVATTTVSGSLNSNANTSYLVQFFANTTADPSGNGQGAVLIGSTTVMTDATGNATFTNLPLSTGVSVQPGSFISATATDQSGVNTKGDTSEFSADAPAQGTADLSLTGTVAPNGPIFAGQSVTYTLNVVNNGPDTARGTTLTDNLPIGATFVNATTTKGTFSQSGNILTFRIGDLPATPGSNTVTITITVIATPANVPTMTDSATVATTDFDPTLPDNTVTLTNTINPVVDLSLTLDSSPNPVLVGGLLQYTLAVSNNSGTQATNVVVTDTLDPNETFVSATTQPFVGTPSFLNGVVTASLGTIPANQTIDVTILVRPTAASINPATNLGSVTENATITSYDQSASDPTPLDNSATTTTTVSPAVDLTVTYNPLPTPDPVHVNAQLTYTIVVTNNGPSNANNVILTDSLDPSVTYVSATTTQIPPVTPSLSGQTLTLNLGRILATPGSNTVTVTIVVTPNASAINDPVNDRGTVANSVSVTSTETDLNPLDNMAQVTSGVTPVISLSFGTPLVNGIPTTVNGTPPPGFFSGPVFAGQPLAYTFTVTNSGPSTAQAVTLTDNLPPNVSYVSASSSQGTPPSQNNGTVTALLGALLPGATATVTINVTATGAAALAGSVTNTASVTAAPTEFDSTPPPPVSVKTNVNPAAALVISVVGGPNPILVGPTSDLKYTVTVTNNGPSDATNVVITDTLDPSVSFINAFLGSTPLPGPTGGVITANVSKLLAGATATLTVHVHPGMSGNINNSATANATEFDPNSPTPGAPVTASTTTMVLPSADLKVTLTGTPNPVTTGANLTYIATVTNYGPSLATNVVLTDTLPAGLTVVSAIPSSGGSLTQSANVLTERFASLPSGGTGTLTIIVTPNSAGTLTNLATAVANEVTPNAGDGQASVVTTVIPPPGNLQFSSPVYTVNETDGIANIAVSRLNGAQGTVTINYTTTSGSATPGTDFLPVSGTLVFGQGETTKSFAVPVLANPFDRHDEVVGLQLSAPNGGAILGFQNSSSLVIRDIDPDVVPPTVIGLNWFGGGNATAITGIVVHYSKEVNPASATNLANYHIANPANMPVALASSFYDPNTHTVVLFTAAPLVPNLFYHIDINGSQPGAVADSANNLLAGAGPAGSDYQLFFASGNNLNYTDAGGNQVSLQLRNGGFLDVSRYANGQGADVTVLGARLHRTTLSGRVRGGRRTGGSGVTSFNSINGLGRFGDVRVLLRTPPFYVANFPYVGGRVSQASVNTALSTATPGSAQPAVFGAHHPRRHR